MHGFLLYITGAKKNNDQTISNRIGLLKFYLDEATKAATVSKQSRAVQALDLDIVAESQ